MADETSDATSDTNLPVDHLIDILNDAVSALPESPYTQVSDTIASDSAAFFDSVMAAVLPSEPGDPSNTGKADLSPFYHQRELDRARADAGRRTSLRAAVAPMEQGNDDWQLAVNQYNFAVAQAKSTLNAAIADAQNSYSTKFNRDSTSRSANLYYELKEAVAAAVQAYNGAVSAAAATLAGDAGQLIATYASYVGAVETAQAQYQGNLATASQTFWQSVEGVLDQS